MGLSPSFDGTAKTNRIDTPTLNQALVITKVLPEEMFNMSAQTVLLVDDDRSTQLFVRFALKHISQPPALQYVNTAFLAIQYLNGQDQFSERDIYPFPDLILLDLKMPLMDGFDLLQWLRARPAFNHVPVIILTGSLYQPDTFRALQLGANACLVKVVELLDFEQQLQKVLVNFLKDAAHPQPLQAIAS